MLTRDFQSQRIGNEASQVIEGYRERRQSWVDFCLFPDILEPVRMPSLFPVPTHVFKRQQLATISLASGESGYNIRMLWSPAHNAQIESGLNSGVLYYRKVNASDSGYTSLDTTNDDTVTVSTAAVAGKTTAVSGVNIPGISGDVAHGGIRLIGAFIELEYIGTADQHSGTIEVGFHAHSRDDRTSEGALHFANDSEIIQMPFYKRYRPSEGARCIWFPIDQQDFLFAPAGAGVTTPVSTTQTFRPIAVQWCININGLQVGQTIRCHVCNVYESIPDEASQDLFCPKKADSAISLDGARQAVSAVVAQGGATTPSKTSGNFQVVYDAIKGAASMASDAYGLYKVMSNPIGAIGGLFGIGGGSMGNFKY